MKSDDCNATATNMTPLSLEGDEQELRRHAGEAYLNHLNNTIAEESKGLYQVIANHLHLRDFVNTIELRFRGNGQEEQLYSTSSLDHWCSGKRDDGSTFLFFPDKFNPVPLSQIKRWNLFLGGQNLDYWGNSDNEIDIANGGVINGQLKVSLTARTFSGKEMMIGGDICKLNKIDLERFSNGSYGFRELEAYLDSGEVLNSPDAVFVPCSLTFFRETQTQYEYHFHAIEKLRLKSSSSEVNKVRLKVLTAFGTEKNDGFKLNENNCLKKWIRELADIAALIDDVKLIRNSETVSAKLSHGEAFQLESPGFEPRQGWKVPVSTTMNDLRSLVVEVSGVPFWRCQGGDFNRIGNEGHIKIYVGPVIIYGFVSLESFDQRQSDSWFHSCYQSMHHGEGHVEYTVFAIVFRLESIKDTLEALGIDRQNATSESPSTTPQETLNALL